MPVTKSAKKAYRQAQKRQAQNDILKRDVERAIKAVKKAATQKDASSLSSLLPTAYKKIDKAAKRNVINKNTASRQKSGLAKLNQKIAQ